jgi:homoserine O-acetyltransferase
MLQKRLVERVFDDASIALAMGWSMGGMQALQWACLFPKQVRAVLATCCTARCYPHNRVFLEGVKAALTCDQTYEGGRYRTPPERGLRAFGRVYAGWAYSQTFFRHELWRNQGFNSIEELLDFWEKDHLGQDANDLLTVLDTWQKGDISDNPIFGRDYEAALSAIVMHTRMMPSTTDLYFTEDDALEDGSRMPGATVEPLKSDWGHIAGGAGRESASHDRVLAAARALLSGEAS